MEVPVIFRGFSSENGAERSFASLSAIATKARMAFVANDAIRARTTQLLFSGPLVFLGNKNGKTEVTLSVRRTWP
jgi:hypothetical protein